MPQILMLQSVLRAWRAGEAGRMLEAGRRYSDAPAAGVSLGPVDTAVLARLVSDGFARYDATTVSVAGEAVAPGGFVRGGAPLGPLSPVIDTATGALVNPATGNTPAAGDEFHVFGGLGRIRVQNTGDSSETFTLTYYLSDGTTDTATETLAAGYDEDWPINALGLDHLTWASTGTGASVETY